MSESLDDVIDRTMQLEHSIETSDVENSEQAFARAHDVEGTVIRANALERSYEHTETCRIEKGDFLNVHNELRIATVDSGHDDFPQLGRGVDIDFSGNLDDVKSLEISFQKRQVHACIEPANDPALPLNLNLMTCRSSLSSHQHRV